MFRQITIPAKDLKSRINDTCFTQTPESSVLPNSSGSFLSTIFIYMVNGKKLVCGFSTAFANGSIKRKDAITHSTVFKSISFQSSRPILFFPLSAFCFEMIFTTLQIISVFSAAIRAARRGFSNLIFISANGTKTRSLEAVVNNCAFCHPAQYRPDLAVCQ